MADNIKSKESKSELNQLATEGERLLEAKEYTKAEQSFLKALMLIRKSGIDDDPEIKIQKIFKRDAIVILDAQFLICQAQVNGRGFYRVVCGQC